MPPSFGFSHIWTQGDGVTRLILAVLIVMSVISWIVMLVKALGVWRHKRSAQQCEQFWQASNLNEGLGMLQAQPGQLFYSLAVLAQAAATHHHSTHPQLRDQLDISDWVTRSLRNGIDEHIGSLQSGLAVLASIGSTAPFVGLFGTVWGIYHALISIGASGNAGIDAVAGPIGETLIMTALGLAVAIPAVLGYNALVRGNKFIIARMNRFAHDLHAYHVTGARIGTAASGAH